MPCAGLVLLRRKRTPKRRSRPERLKEVPPYAVSLHSLGWPVSSQVERPRSPSAHFLKILRRALDVEKVCGLDAVVRVPGLGVLSQQNHETVALAVRQWMNDPRVHEAEHCRVRANAQRQR